MCPDGQGICLPRATEMFSADLKKPHGLDFIDDDTIIVANRYGDTTIFALPAISDRTEHHFQPIGVIEGGLMLQPGSVVVAGRSGDRLRVLICNNEAHTVSEHSPDLTGKTAGPGGVLLHKWLDIPDGIALSRKGRIAISNHNTHGVLIYEHGRHLHDDSDPDGIARGCFYPHGVRFTQDERFLLVADAGAPYVHVYMEDDHWSGVHQPRVSLRVLSEEDFQRGRHDPQQGGPKGLDIDEARGLLVTTCETQPLAFFDLAALLRSAAQGFGERSGLNRDHRSPLQVMCELELVQACNQAKRAAESNLAEARVLNRYLLESKSWRITAPMRFLYAKLRRLAGR